MKQVFSKDDLEQMFGFKAMGWKLDSITAKVDKNGEVEELTLDLDIGQANMRKVAKEFGG